jgi:hypothetical protein
VNKRIVLQLSLVLILLAMIYMNWHDHAGLVHPDKPVWKVSASNDFSNRGTALVNFYQRHTLVHPKTLVWKEFTLDDSATYNQKTVR